MSSATVANEKTVVAFLNASEGAVGYLRLLAQFATNIEEERGLKKLLKKLAAADKILKLKGKRYAKITHVVEPSVGVKHASHAPKKVHGVAETAPAAPGKADPAADGTGPASRRHEAAKRTNQPLNQGSDKPASDSSVKARIVREGKFLFALAGEGKKKLKFVIPKSKDAAPAPGEWVMVRPLGRNGPYGYPAAKVVSGEAGHGGEKRSPEFAAVSRAFFKERGIPMAYPKKALEEAEAAPEPSEDRFEGRLDMRGDHVVTIDPADAKDHDDAISVKKLPDGSWKVAVHIADVSEYVQADGALDDEALRRAYTQYLPWTAAPMLPQRLSGDLCSLLEGKDRLAFTCLMTVSAKGDLKAFEFAETVINVARFHSYEEAQRLKDEGDKGLGLLAEFADLLLARRKEEGYLDFQLPEPKVVLNEAREPMDIRPGVRLPSHGWVEECMLLANRACAQYIHQHKVPGLYRVHEQPDVEVVEELWAHQSALSGRVEPADALRLRETEGYLNPRVQQFYVKLLDSSRGALPPALQRKILQSMKKAQYDARPLGHFALGWQYYAHFTSPIRRYADLWTHRMMKKHARGQKIPKLLRTRAIAVAEEISQREIDVVKIERKAMRTATAWIFKDLVGREMLGEISGTENFGVFVTVSNPYGEGLVPVNRLRDDYYEKDPETGHLVGRRHGRRFELGQKIKVRVSRSDPFAAQIDFDFLGFP
jgi:ribonuclease R